MFSFFSKNNYLVDHLEGFVDIHNHILPGIDDGAKNVGESIELIKAFGEFGVKDFICTPHIMHNYYDNSPNTINASFEKLKKELKKEGLDNINIRAAAEHMIDDNFENILEEGNIMPLGNNHLLVEMSYLQPSINFEIAVKKIQSAGLFPVFAHPERYAYLHQDFGKYEYYKSLGIKFQLNMLSLSNYYGKEINKIALKLLELSLYDYTGSDVHNLKHLDVLKSIKIGNWQIIKMKNILFLSNLKP